MGSYIPSSPQEQQEMLRAAGFSGFDALYADLPPQLRLAPGALDLPAGLSELEMRAQMERLAGQNTVFPHLFRGAGAYRHYIPAIVQSVVGKEEFVTAYTPYQAEISQGILQSIFEYQTMICELTGMEASNASVYDGATAAAEALAMCKERGRTVALVSAAAQPQVRSVLAAYCFGSGMELRLIPEREGRTDLDALAGLLGSSVACVYLQQPNFYGCLEDCARAAELAHGAGAKLILGCNPISLALLKSPGEYGADVAVGEGQPLGLPLAFGGPYLGFMATTKALMRRLPGRIVGQTADADGKRAYVLTLQAREQHIRREKASSNICSNQALCAMTAAAYLSAMGAEGLTRVAQHCMANARLLEAALAGAGYSRKHAGPYFHEFVTTCPGPAAQALRALEAQGYLGGLPVGENELLWCATELNTPEEIETLAAILKEVGKA